MEKQYEIKEHHGIKYKKMITATPLIPQITSGNEKYIYTLLEDYKVQTPVYPLEKIYTHFIVLDRTGEMLIKLGYAWDGPSGVVTFHTKNFIRGSLIHDAFYQLMRENHLKNHVWRDETDKFLKTCCLEDGMCNFRSNYVYETVKLVGEQYTQPLLNA